VVDPTFSKIKFGDGLGVTDEGSGVIRVDGGGGAPLEWSDVGTGATGGTGIQFETYPQTGDWLFVETTTHPSSGGEPPTYGIVFRAADGTRIEGSVFMAEASGDGIRIESLGGGGTVLTETDGGGMSIYSGGGGLTIRELSGGMVIEAGGGLSIRGNAFGRIDFSSADGGIRIQPESGAKLKITNLPTSNPAIVNAVWNDSGTLKLSAG
jgi:hypothetical protein